MTVAHGTLPSPNFKNKLHTYTLSASINKALNNFTKKKKKKKI